MDDCSEASLLRKLESSDYANIHGQFSQFLQPLTLHLLNPQIPSTAVSKSSKSKSKPIPPSSSTIRSLLKSYLPFLNRSLSLLPKRLSDTVKPSAAEADELFVTYRLCLDCVGCFSSLLSCKPYSVHLQTARFVRCLVEWGRYSEAMDEAFRVLKAVGEMELDGVMDCGERCVPVLVDGSGVDGDLAYLVVEVVLRVFQSVAMSKTKDCVQYQNLLELLNGIQPWLRVLDNSVSHKFNRSIVSCMNKATRLLAKLGADLLPKFCAATFDEYQKLLGEKAVEDDGLKLSTEFLELLSYCAYECRASSIGIHDAVASSMLNMDLEPFAFISRLYASGLHFSSSKLQVFQNADSTCLMDNPQVQELNSLLSSVRTLFAVYSKENKKATKVHAQETRKIYIKFYLEALKFLCRPLAEFVNTERKNIFNQVLDSSLQSYLQIVQTLFCELCDMLFSCHSCSSDTNIDGSEAIDKTVLKVSVASFVLSLKLNLNRKKSLEFLQFLLSGESIQYQEIKYLLVSLYDIGLDCYKNKLLKESVEAMKLCYEASWTCGLSLCQIHAGKKKHSVLSSSEEAILDIASKASTSTSFFLDILFEEDSYKLGNAIMYSLRKWSTMRDLFGKLPSPQSLVKQWVKIQCKSYKKAGNKDFAPTLYSFIVDSGKGDGCSPFYVSKGTISIILEQELSAYQEMSNLCPEFCREMQMKVINLLLHDVHVTRDDWIEKSKFLIKKGKLFREFGTEYIKNSISCLSEAIDTITGANKETNQCSISNSLAVAYSLRALSMHEADPSSGVQQMKVLCDIQEAVKIWLNCGIISEPSCHMGDEDCSYILQLLYNIIDLLSLKGTMDPNICKLLIKTFNDNNKPLEKCLLMLWESRRLSHALCVSPINEVFFDQLSEDYGDAFKSVRYWLNCMKDAQSALFGFKQNFSILRTQFPQAFGWYEHSIKSNVAVDDIKEAALHLIQSDRNDSSFIVGCLYYDLAERLLSAGQLIEALHWAKQAHQLRCKLLQERFSYMLEKQEEKYTVHGEVISSHPVFAKYFRVCTHIAMRAWDSAASSDSDGCNLTPWKVLECYLESNLQVGIIQEVIGNGTEAEALFSWGKSISCLQGLPLFAVAFSAGLGNFYHKMRLWELADKELQSAKKVLLDSREATSCLRCHLMMESNVDWLLGNLYRSRNESSEGGLFINPVSVEKHYKSALALLHSSEWKGENKDKILLQTFPATQGGSSGASCNVHSFATDLSNSMQSCSIKELGLEKQDNRKCGRKKKEPSRPQTANCQVTERTSRITRSRIRSSQDKACNGEREVLDVHKNKCTKCFFLEDRKVDSFMEFTHMKWELGRRKHLLRVLIDLGKWKQDQAEVHGAHEVYSQCISLLGCRNPLCDCSHSQTCIHMLELINKEVSEDILAVERAAALYNICWLSLKSIVPRERRTSCCNLSHIELSDIVSFLTHSFVLCREVPLLFEKVSRLLATIYVISACRSNFSFSIRSSPDLSENHWAAYFHQASVSARHNHWVLSHLAVKQKHITETLGAKGSQGHDANSMFEDIHSLFRLAPDSTQSVTAFIKNFFESLPTTTIVCLSILGGSYASIMKALVPDSPSNCSWMLLSHFNASSEPVVILLPIDVIAKDTELIASSSKRYSVVDVVAPTFNSILEESKSCTASYSEDTEKNRSMWWSKRKGLDRLLSKLLSEMEESWLGPWKYLVLGQWSENQAFESAAKKLASDLKRRCNLDVKAPLIKTVLGAVKFSRQEEVSIPRIVLEKGCYVGMLNEGDEAEDEATDNVHENDTDHISRVAFELMLAAVDKLEEEHSTNRESVILVLDSEVQVLPWENMPILRDQEVYRMPSISCISAVLQKPRTQHGSSAVDPLLPLIDPLDAFYVVNPSGDLQYTQAEFEEWFRGQNLEGQAGTAPTSEELSAALKSHDVFLYFGHGSGAQYIPMHEIQKLENCAACLLMGCSSASLIHNGSYTPRGIVYSYISAGSPVVIANLWPVTDRDIDRFARAVLEAWFAERSKSLASCVQCSILAEEMSSLTLKKTRNAKKGKVNNPKDGENTSGKNWCRHKVKVGYFVSKARNACKLPYLIGAAPVCYGVPTGIRKKNDA